MRYAYLAANIQRFAADLPAELSVRIAAILLEPEAADWGWRRWQLRQAVAQPDLTERLNNFLEVWQNKAPDVPASSVAMGLLAAAEAESHYRQGQQLELVWTGPDSQVIPLRRTDQALLQLISGAEKELHIVSFAVYKARAVTEALVRAAARHVAVSIYLETADASEGKISFDTIGALGQALIEQARVYVWPLEKRPTTADGRYGSLHAKIALADDLTMLISSANLTEYALTLNMEMGLLVHGGPLPAQAALHLRRLVEQGFFVQDVNKSGG